MRSSPRTHNLAGLALAALVASSLPALAGPGDVGTPAAGFTLAELGGGTRSLDQHLGEVVFLAIIGYG